MKRFTKLAVALLLFGLGVNESHAISANETLKGEVTEAATGEPIPGASVLIEELNRGVAADADGQFEFRDVPYGSYTLSIRAVGFRPFTREVNHPADGKITVELQAEVLRGEEVIVTSSPLGRSIQYQPAQALNREQLQQKAAPSLGEILDGNPGVSTRSFGSAPSRPVIRGLDGDRVLVLQNGERMGDLSGTAVDHAV